MGLSTSSVRAVPTFVLAGWEIVEVVGGGVVGVGPKVVARWAIHDLHEDLGDSRLLYEVRVLAVEILSLELTGEGLLEPHEAQEVRRRPPLGCLGRTRWQVSSAPKGNLASGIDIGNAGVAHELKASDPFHPWHRS